jgi:hypothetical protein
VHGVPLYMDVDGLASASRKFYSCLILSFLNVSDGNSYVAPQLFRILATVSGILDVSLCCIRPSSGRERIIDVVPRDGRGSNL